MAKESNLSWDKEGRGEMEMRFHISFCDFAVCTPYCSILHMF